MDGRAAHWTRGDASGVAGALFDHSDDALVLVDPLNETIVDANPAAENLLGCARADLVGWHLRSLLRHEQQWQEGALNLLSPAPFAAPEGYLVRSRSQNTWIPVGLTVTRVQPGDQDPLALVAFRDRREHLETARRLQRSEAELRRLLTSVSDCVWSARVEPDGSFRYRYLSPAVQHLTGRTPAVFLEDPLLWLNVVHPDDRPAWQAFHQRLRAGQPGNLEFRLHRPDGSQFRVQESVTLTPDEGGLLLHGVVSEIHLPGQSARQQTLDRLASFAGTVAHDFNNLLTGILGHLSLARLNPVTQQSSPEGLEQIEALTLRGADLCRQLSTVAGRNRTTGFTPEPGRLIKHLAGSSGVRGPVRMELASNLPAVMLDPNSLHQLLNLLLSNAEEARHSDDHEIVLRLRLASKGEEGPPFLEGLLPCFSYFHPHRDNAAACLWLEVQDNGAGIPPEVQGRLFEPFASTRTGNRGLGLAQVLGIVRGCHGGIEVWTRPGTGTLVRLSLPAREEAYPPVKAVREVREVATQTSGLRPCTVLLADDEEAVRDVSTRLISSLGYTVIPCKNGEEAVTTFQKQPDEITVAIIDLTMPRLGGELTLRELRRLSPRVALVLMSGYPEADILPRFADLRLQGYLQKPFRLPTLVEMLRRIQQAEEK